MNALINNAKELIGNGQFEAAVAELCTLGPPETAEVCELIAKAYQGRNKARGDVFTAKVFAKEALSYGSTDPVMNEIMAADARNDKPLEHALEKPTCQMGGLNPKNAPSILSTAIDHFGDRITMATSFQLGGLVLLDMIHKLGKEIRIFSLDTGRLPEETYECSERIRQKYGIAVDWVFPRHGAVQKLEKEKGLYSFKESIENRKECCGIRKVEPLNRALEPFDAWITGRRMDQSETRQELNIIEPDPAHSGKLKINPLVNWSKGDLWFYVEENKVPHNRLYDEGYLSIGCECCTRPCREGEDERAGRWWWENTEHKECGLHLSGGAGI